MKHLHTRRMTMLAHAILISLAATSLTAHADTPLEYASVAELNSLMAANELTSVALIEHFNRRIADLDKQGPALHAIIELNPQAADIAKAMDQEREAGKVRGPLHGIPVLLKDNIDTADQMQTSAGSMAMVGQPAAKDAFLVSQLRDAGAIILGKTNMSEWAYVREQGLPHGWSGRGGQGKNPHQLSGEICGSSSGSAAGVAAGFAPLAIGTETNGSIACPANANAVVGVKPTLGLFSRSGLVPITRLQDTPGTLTRSVQDAAMLFNVLQGTDASDSATATAPVGIDYTELLAADALNGKRIGYPTAYVGTNGSELTSSTEHLQALATLKSQGAILVPLTIRLPDIDGYFEGLMGAMKHELPDYLASRSGLSIQSLQALIDFNRLNPGDEGYGQEMLETINSMDMTHQVAGNLIASVHESYKRAIDEQLSEHNLDGLVSEADGYSQYAAAVAGYPAITLPAGIGTDGVPTSTFFFGAAWSEPQLFAMAYSYEQASLKLQHPSFKE